MTVRELLQALVDVDRDLPIVLENHGRYHDGVDATGVVVKTVEIMPGERVSYLEIRYTSPPTPITFRGDEDAD